MGNTVHSVSTFYLHLRNIRSNKPLEKGETQLSLESKKVLTEVAFEMGLKQGSFQMPNGFPREQ